MALSHSVCSVSNPLLNEMPWVRGYPANGTWNLIKHKQQRQTTNKEILYSFWSLALQVQFTSIASFGPTTEQEYKNTKDMEPEYDEYI